MFLQVCFDSERHRLVVLALNNRENVKDAWKYLFSYVKGGYMRLLSKFLYSGTSHCFTSEGVNMTKLVVVEDIQTETNEDEDHSYFSTFISSL